MRKLLITLLCLVGCAATPTTENHWFLEADELTSTMLDEPSIMAALDYYWMELGVSFEVGIGNPKVFLYWGDRDAEILGECGTGKNCGINVAAVGLRPEDIAVVISHEMGHSYGLGHTNDDPYNVMNAQYNTGAKHNWDEEQLEHLRKVIDNE